MKRGAPDQTQTSRRSFVSLTAGALATLYIAEGHALFAAPESSNSGKMMKQVKAGVLDVAYLESGPADGPAVVLLHGFPYDVHS